jgi:hypothetical protein
MKIMRLLTASLFAASAALSAQEDEKPLQSYLAFGFTLAQGHAHDMTQTTWRGPGAFVGEFGLEFRLPQIDAKLRPNFGVTKLLGADPTETQRTFDLMGFYVGFDIVYSPIERLPALYFTTGPSMHVWNVDEKGAIAPNQGYKNIKFGWRLGSTYKINEHFSATLDYALTEWRKDKSSTVFIPGVNPSRPSYFTVKCSYTF